MKLIIIGIVTYILFLILCFFASYYGATWWDKRHHLKN